MEAEGLCFTKRGLGTFVTEDQHTLDRIRSEMAEDLLDHFINGMKHLSYSKEELCRMISDKYNEGEAK
jgi:DNA-binding transcriptional regulator YhcF (GntR family)